MNKNILALIIFVFVTKAIAVENIKTSTNPSLYTQSEIDALTVTNIEISPVIVDETQLFDPAPIPGTINGGIAPAPGPQVPGPAPIPGQGPIQTPPNGPVLGGNPANPVDQVIMIIDGLLALGKKIWPIIDAGRPVIDEKLAPAVSVLPHLNDSTGVLNEMENWSAPKVLSYRVSATNKWGSEVIAFTYSILFQYNGDLNGKGKYVTSLKVITSDIVTSWGFDLAASSELISISNVGSMANPVASAIISIHYAIKGKFNEMRNANSIYVDGTGKIESIGK